MSWRKMLVALGLVVLSTGTGYFFAQLQKAEGPAISFQDTLVDFGTAHANRTIELEFPFANVGNSALIIERVEDSSCACTSTLPSGRRFEPGQKGSIKVRYRAPYAPGPVLRRVTVETNAPKDPNVRLAFHGKIERGISWVPLAIDFGSVQHRALPVERAFKVYAPSGMDDFVIDSVQGSSDFTTATVRRAVPEVYRILPHYEGVVGLRPGIPLGEFSGKVSLHTNCSTQPVLNIPLKATMLGDWRARPDRLAFGRISIGDSTERKIELIANGTTDPLTVPAKVDVEGSCFSARLADQTGSSSLSIVVTAEPDREDVGNAVGELVVYFVDDSTPLRVRLSALVVD